VTSTGTGVRLEARLYEVSKGATAVLTKTYTGSKADLRRLVHSWANEVVKYYTKEDGFFGSRIAFVSKGRGQSAIMAMDFDGHGAYGVSRNGSINLLPAWSPSGGQIAFTSYMRNNPDLYLVGAGGGRPKKISTSRGMNTGASWSPDGSKLAVTMSRDGNPEIYVVSAKDGSVLARLTNNKAIDTSPAWSPDGSQIAFVSDRDGSPQIFVMPAGGGGATRVSFNGNYNSTPAWSPAKGQRVLAYATRDGGNFDIVTLDLATKKMTRVTQNEGNNEEPSFSPNGRAIAFARTGGGGSGVYLAPADGKGTAVKIYSGSVTGVDWGPAPAAP
jgi:TolB protein